MDHSRKFSRDNSGLNNCSANKCTALHIISAYISNFTNSALQCCLQLHITVQFSFDTLLVDLPSFEHITNDTNPFSANFSSIYFTKINSTMTGTISRCTQNLHSQHDILQTWCRTVASRRRFTYLLHHSLPISFSPLSNIIAHHVPFTLFILDPHKAPLPIYMLMYSNWIHINCGCDTTNVQRCCDTTLKPSQTAVPCSKSHSPFPIQLLVLPQRILFLFLCVPLLRCHNNTSFTHSLLFSVHISISVPNLLFQNV